MRRFRREQVCLWVSLVAFLAATACKEEPAAPPKEKSGDAGTPAKSSGVDKDLAEAVAAVAGGADPAAAGGPPPTGVFAAGAADREHPKGAFPKLSVGSKGGEPTITFGVAERKKLSGLVQVSVQLGPRSALPTVDLSLAVEPASAPKTESEAKPTAPIEVLVKVTAAKLSAEQPGELPPGLAQEIAKLKGCKLEYQVDASGAGRLDAVELAPGVDNSLGQIVRSAADALAVEFLPFPEGPVGVGAYWLVTSRDTYAGLDVVAYRMIKLEKLEAGRAVLSVNTRRYTAGGQIGFEGLPPHRVEEFAGPTQGQIAVLVQDPSVVEGQLSDVIQAGLSPAAPAGAQPPPGQKMGVEFRVRSRLSMARN